MVVHGRVAACEQTSPVAACAMNVRGTQKKAGGIFVFLLSMAETLSRFYFAGNHFFAKMLLKSTHENVI